MRNPQNALVILAASAHMGGATSSAPAALTHVGGGGGAALPKPTRNGLATTKGSHTNRMSSQNAFDKASATTTSSSIIPLAVVQDSDCSDVEHPTAKHTNRSADWSSSCNRIPRGGGGSGEAGSNQSERNTSKRKAKRNNTQKHNTTTNTGTYHEKNPSDGRNQTATNNENRKDNKTTSSSTANSTTGSTPANARSTSEQRTKSSNRRMDSIIEDILNEEDYYKILGTTKASIHQSSQPERDIQKCYRKRAVQTHPDKTGGDRRAFDKVAEAYEILHNATQRSRYDRYGKAGLGTGGGASTTTSGMQGMAAEDLFRSFFGTSSTTTGHPFQQGPSRNRSVRFQLEVTLEDLYLGRSVTVQLPTGKSVQVNIPRGAQDHEILAVSGVMDEDTRQAPGDLLLQLQRRQHHTFTRRGYDLAIPVTITLQEALTGCQRKIRHLDGTIVHIVSAAADEAIDVRHPAIIQTGDIQVLPGRGMPKDYSGTKFGDLYVQYKVEIPKTASTKSKGTAATNTLSLSERRELQRLLNKLEGKPPKNSEWPFSKSRADRLQKASLSDFGRASGTPPQSNAEEFSEFSPFGSSSSSSSSRFFWSSAAGNGMNHPFFGASGGNSHGAEFGNDPNEQTQCRQM